jgi:hypothetical protein
MISIEMSQYPPLTPNNAIGLPSYNVVDCSGIAANPSHKKNDTHPADHELRQCRA